MSVECLLCVLCMCVLCTCMCARTRACSKGPREQVGVLSVQVCTCVVCASLFEPIRGMVCNRGALSTIPERKAGQGKAGAHAHVPEGAPTASVQHMQGICLDVPSATASSRRSLLWPWRRSLRASSPPSLSALKPHAALVCLRHSQRLCHPAPCPTRCLVSSHTPSCSANLGCPVGPRVPLRASSAMLSSHAITAAHLQEGGQRWQLRLG